MADNDYNIIKPVESPHSIAGLTGAKRRQERKRRQDLHGGQKEESESTEAGLDESAEQESLNERTDDETDQHSIDYCA